MRYWFAKNKGILQWQNIMNGNTLEDVKELKCLESRNTKSGSNTKKIKCRIARENIAFDNKERLTNINSIG